MEVNKALGMVIGGRAARACDVCGHERARWYCAADEAYLCERCDSSVHSANAVAKRHDRVRLGPNGAPMKIERSSTGVVKRELSFRSAHRGSRRRPRSSRHHPPRSRFTSSRSAETNLGNPQLADVKVKPEPSSPEPEGQVPENHLLESLFDSKELPGDAVLHEVPIYMSMDQELPVFDYADPLELKPANEISNQVSVDQPRDAGDPDDESLDLLVPDNCIDIDCFLDEGGDLCDLEVDMDCMAGQNDESLCVDGIGMFSLCDSRVGKGTCYDLDSSDHRVLNVDSDCHSDREYEEVYQNGESPRSWLCKVKVESPPQDLGATELVEADAILGQKLEGCRSEGRPKLGLRLNFEDVLNAWSDRGSLWMNGQRPQVVPDESSLDYLEIIWGLFQSLKMPQAPLSRKQERHE